MFLEHFAANPKGLRKELNEIRALPKAFSLEGCNKDLQVSFEESLSVYVQLGTEQTSPPLISDVNDLKFCSNVIDFYLLKLS